MLKANSQYHTFLDFPEHKFGVIVPQPVCSAVAPFQRYDSIQFWVNGVLGIRLVDALGGNTAGLSKPDAPQMFTQNATGRVNIRILVSDSVASPKSWCHASLVCSGRGISHGIISYPLSIIRGNPSATLRLPAVSRESYSNSTMCVAYPHLRSPSKLCAYKR